MARWLPCVSYCPGPASSQAGLTLGFLQRGYTGAAAAWLGFTLPSALLMTLFALGLGLWPDAGAGGWVTGLKLFVVAVIAVFLPGTLLVFAGLPLWSYIRNHEVARAALAGLNAGVVGLLLAALYDPVWTSAVDSPGQSRLYYSPG